MSQKTNTPSIHNYCEVKTDLGRFWIACSPRGITRICPRKESAGPFESEYKTRTGMKLQKGPVPEQYKRALHDALRGKQTSPECIDWDYFTPFQRKVLRQLLRVRAGTVRSYSWLARESGHPKAARAAGNVMAQNPIPFLLPCHRIVPAAGGIGNYGYGQAMKRALLEREGVKFPKKSRIDGGNA
jgi:O-6-methylguanine DNA methyltransferase